MILLANVPLEQKIALIVALIVGLSVHEFAHARTAFALGDLTAYASGRMTLDPRKHIDPVGALVFLFVGFGWARPVPIDPYRLGRQGTLLVALAGPVSNVILAFLALLPIRFGLLTGVLGGTTVVILASFLAFFAVLNVMLAVFNMLPIAPLDGWRVLMGIVPAETAARLRSYEQVGGVLLLMLILVGRIGNTSILSLILDPLISAVLFVIAGPDLAAQFNY